MKTPVFFSVAILAAAFVASTSAGSSFCDKAEDKLLCSDLVGGAKTWEEAMTNALKGVEKKAERGKLVEDLVVKKLPEKLYVVTKDSIVMTCRHDYETIMFYIKDCLGYVKDDPTNALPSSLGAITYSDCTDALAQFNVTVAEATEFHDEIYKLVTAMLSVAEKKP